MQSGVSIVMDTSHSPLLLAVEKDGKLFTARRSGIKQEKLLFPVLNGLLAKANANLQDVSRVFIIRGPGRFTGIRIALTFASMLQMLGDCEVKGATLFEVIYRQVQACRAYASWQQNHPSGVAAVVCITMALTVLVAKVVGCTLPMFAKRLGFDPAVMASPFITTIVDALSLLVYFGIATALLGL